jgi:phosphatidate cytidylyltransferase
VTRVLSGAVLITFAVVVVWWAPAAVFFAVAEACLVLACMEYVRLANASGVDVHMPVPIAAAALTAAAFARLEILEPGGLPIDAVLMSALVAVGALSLAQWRGGKDAIATVSASLLPALYLGLPIGAMIALRESRGPEVLFLLMITVVASDTGQYYIGRAFGRRPLAAGISPKKTIEGAVGGFLIGGATLAVVGGWWLPLTPVWLRALLGVTMVALGIAGDLFESMLKRSAGVKDSSALIPGHGGVLDRIDALLFAAPVYYIVLRYV